MYIVCYTLGSPSCHGDILLVALVATDRVPSCIFLDYRRVLSRISAIRLALKYFMGGEHRVWSEYRVWGPVLEEIRNSEYFRLNGELGEDNGRLLRGLLGRRKKCVL